LPTRFTRRTPAHRHRFSALPLHCLAPRLPFTAAVYCAHTATILPHAHAHHRAPPPPARTCLPAALRIHVSASSAHCYCLPRGFYTLLFTHFYRCLAPGAHTFTLHTTPVHCYAPSLPLHHRACSTCFTTAPACHRRSPLTRVYTYWFAFTHFTHRFCPFTFITYTRSTFPLYTTRFPTTRFTWVGLHYVCRFPVTRYALPRTAAVYYALRLPVAAYALHRTHHTYLHGSAHTPPHTHTLTTTFWLPTLFCSPTTPTFCATGYHWFTLGLPFVCVWLTYPFALAIHPPPHTTGFTFCSPQDPTVPVGWIWLRCCPGYTPLIYICAPPVRCTHHLHVPPPRTVTAHTHHRTHHTTPRTPAYHAHLHIDDPHHHTYTHCCCCLRHAPLALPYSSAYAPRYHSSYATGGIPHRLLADIGMPLLRHRYGAPRACKTTHPPHCTCSCFIGLTWAPYPSYPHTPAPHLTLPPRATACAAACTALRSFHHTYRPPPQACGLCAMRHRDRLTGSHCRCTATKLCRDGLADLPAPHERRARALPAATRIPSTRNSAGRAVTGGVGRPAWLEGGWGGNAVAGHGPWATRRPAVISHRSLPSQAWA